ncbi:MAG: RNA-binding protein [Salinirussus sp.]
MATAPMHYVEVRAFCYATEAADRVVAALRTILPEDIEVERTSTEGHHGDPIDVLSARVETSEGIEAVLDALEDLPDADYDRFLDELDERIDEDCNLFITLDKQAAYGDEVRLGEGITLRGKIEVYPAKREKAIEQARDVLEPA